MVPQHIIDQVRQIPIPGFLESLSFQCISHYRTNLRFENPLRNEASPSFDVSVKKNVWTDRGTGEGGDIIELVMRIRKCSFLDAVETLLQSATSFSFRRPLIGILSDTAIQQFRIQDLTEPRLSAYLRKRKIDVEIARSYLKEAHYVAKGKPYFNLAFPSQRGGYELRNAFFKGCYGPKAISAFKSREKTSSLLLFEGFMDFLTYLTRTNQGYSKEHVIVLNTTALVKDSLIEKISRFNVHAYLDNDPAGKQAIAKLEENHVMVSDHSIEYHGYKDFNEYHMHTVN